MLLRRVDRNILLEDLPFEIILYVISFLRCRDLLSVFCLSKLWKTIADDGIIWKRLCMEMWNVNILETTIEEDWKEIFKSILVNLPKELMITTEYQQGITILEDRLTAKFDGQIGGDQVVKGDQPFCPPSNKQGHITLEAHYLGNEIRYRVIRRAISYFEITISSNNSPSLGTKNPHWSAECISIGLALSNFPFKYYQPGWKAGSYGYHSDDGRKFDNGQSFNYGPKYGIGDTIGCGIDYEKMEIFFTLNGKSLAASKNAPSEPLWPIVGIDTNNLITLNFGKKPFKYDFSQPPISLTECEDFVEGSSLSDTET